MVRDQVAAYHALASVVVRAVVLCPPMKVRQHSVPRRQRIALSLALGIVGGAVTLQSNLTKSWPRDFSQVWFAGRAVLHGQNPYELIGPGLAFDWPWPFLYPLPAALIGIPFAPLSDAVASVVFLSIGAACFAWALMEHGYGPLFGFFGASLHYAAETAQFSPLLAASLVLSPLALLLVAKPTIGIAFFAARPSRWAILGGVLLGGLALVLRPTWIQEWLAAIAVNKAAWLPAHPYRAPLLYPAGFVALACLFRWRRPEARLVAVLACVPQTAALYETVPLFLVPRTFLEAAVLLGLSYAQANIVAASGVTQWAHVTELSARWSVLLLYIPATLMILRRPNEGPLPAGLERRIARWPRWLRGRATRTTTDEVLAVPGAE